MHKADCQPNSTKRGRERESKQQKSHNKSLQRIATRQTLKCCGICNAIVNCHLNGIRLRVLFAFNCTAHPFCLTVSSLFSMKIVSFSRSLALSASLSNFLFYCSASACLTSSCCAPHNALTQAAVHSAIDWVAFTQIGCIEAHLQFLFCRKCKWKAAIESIYKDTGINIWITFTFAVHLLQGSTCESTCVIAAIRACIS